MTSTNSCASCAGSPPQGERGIHAYRGGYESVLRRRMPYAEQVAMLARALPSENGAAAELAQRADMELADAYTVLVVRVPGRPPGDRDPENDIEALLKTHQVPMRWHTEREPADAPGTGAESGELIALIPDSAPAALPHCRIPTPNPP
ncbi:hypothetical protein [Streptomyces blattellae]|uniref:hypothetical protein n=1 Tax=Streptomyces blattellae TaxID=2569855 RepID=UPI001E4C4E9B|nr:hypothetical protein [Streptomyces blattellae]